MLTEKYSETRVQQKISKLKWRTQYSEPNFKVLRKSTIFRAKCLSLKEGPNIPNQILKFYGRTQYSEPNIIVQMNNPIKWRTQYAEPSLKV